MLELETVRSLLDERQFQSLFVSHLGWDNPTQGDLTIYGEEQRFTASPVAAKRGFTVYVCEQLPSASDQSFVDKEIGKHSAERLVVFADASEQQWKWPEARKSGTGVRLITHTHHVGTRNEALLQRLAALEFTLEEERAGLTILDVRDRVRAQFNAEEVTADFYKDFQEHHTSLLDEIENIPDKDDRSWYSSLLMNRLMFIYFMQKKGFLDDDPHYLRRRLMAVRSRYGPDEFYTFYRDFLLPLFHEGLGNRVPAYDDDLAALVGNVPYINGGIFAVHPIERAYDIDVPDEAFEEIFDFFDSYQWHLDDRPTGEANEINPDVLGYIFEQYINQKEKGAYYTKEDVTGYMVHSSVVPSLLERLHSVADQTVWPLLTRDPDRYIPESLRHGTTMELPEHISATVNTDDSRGGWSEEAPPELALPGETWWEVVERRQRYSTLRAQLAEGTVATITDALTRNIDLLTLLLDGIDSLGTPPVLARFWSTLEDLAVIDPTCGSGAFLFAALEVIAEVYEAVLNKTEELAQIGPEKELQDLLDKVSKHKSRQYFIMKSAILHNLYGVDLMEEAVEIAKLRLFLKLAAQLESREQIEPLPDLDFNIRPGNLLVGFEDREEVIRALGTDVFTAAQWESIEEQLDELDGLVSKFVSAQEDPAGLKDPQTRKAEILDLIAELRDDLDRLYFDANADPSANYDEWRTSHQPLHWLLEFHSVMARGGFDVVIGNPPYIRRTRVEDYSYSGFATDRCPDIFAPCMERSANLTSTNGRFAMIVPLSLTFSDDYEAARRVLTEQFEHRWSSTYAKRPSELFNGVDIRPAIVVGGPGANNRQFTTKHNVWVGEYRPHLFETLRYVELPEPMTDRWYKIGSSGVRAIASELFERAPLEEFEAKDADDRLWYKPVATYWMPVAHEPAPTYEKSDSGAWTVSKKANLKSIGLSTIEERDLALIMMAGKLGYLWWSMCGDDLNVPGWVMRSFPLGADDLEAETRRKLLDLADQLRNALPGQLLWNKNAGKWVGSYDVSAFTELTDQADQLVLADLGVDEHWVDLQIWYHEVMKSTGEATGSERGPIPQEVRTVSETT